MNAFETMRQQAAKIPTVAEQIIAGAEAAFAQAGLDVDDPRAASWVAEYLKTCAEIVRNQALEAAAGLLERNLRRLVLEKRPDESKSTASRERFHRVAAANGWTSEEGDAALARAGDPSCISRLDWRGAEIDGVFVSREELRQSLRTAAYSDEGFARYLSTLPKIEAPEAA